MGPPNKEGFIMAFNNPTTFKGVTSLQKDSLSNNLLLGVQDFLSWGFLQIGAFQNISRDPPVSGHIDNDLFYRYRLRKSDDPNYEIGQVWEGFRNDWVWESGFSYEGTEPITVSGVWVNDSFYGSGDATYSHYVDYPNGRIVFDYPLLSENVVEANFSHRTVGISLADEQYVQELMFNSYEMEDLDSYLISSSGTRNRLGERRLQMPIVALELAQCRGRTGWQLGGGQIEENDLLFHIFAENQFDKNNIRDVILNQSEKVLYLMDRGMMQEKAGYPFQLNGLGYPNDNVKMYPDMVAPTGTWHTGDGGFRWKQARLDNVVSSDMPPVNGWLHRCTIRGTFSVILGVGTNVGNV